MNGLLIKSRLKNTTLVFRHTIVSKTTSILNNLLTYGTL